MFAVRCSHRAQHCVYFFHTKFWFDSYFALTLKDSSIVSHTLSRVVRRKMSFNNRIFVNAVRQYYGYALKYGSLLTSKNENWTNQSLVGIAAIIRYVRVCNTMINDDYTSRVHDTHSSMSVLRHMDVCVWSQEAAHTGINCSLHVRKNGVITPNRISVAEWKWTERIKKRIANT